jgi:serine/threonine protein kinase
MLYRAPEILFHMKRYSTNSDMWSVACIMSEMVRLAPLFEADGELNLISEIFRKLGTPSQEVINFYNDSDLKINTKNTIAEQPLTCYIDGIDLLGADLISVHLFNLENVEVFAI